MAAAPYLQIEYCGEWIALDPDRPFAVGRHGDLVIDDNPYLHRRFLELTWHDGLWWLSNVGTQLAATFAAAEARLQAWLSPGTHLPVVFPTSVIRFTAGRTSYEINLHLSGSIFSGATAVAEVEGDTGTTLGRIALTPDQRLLVVALAEPFLREQHSRTGELPSSAECAERLGWPLTKFNRKLDNVCQKLERTGVQGLHGDSGRLASGRRARLVEYALAVGLVTADDLELLDIEGRLPSA